MRVEDDRDVLAVCRSLERFEPSAGFVERVLACCRGLEERRRFSVVGAVGLPVAAAVFLILLGVGLVALPFPDDPADPALVAAFVEDHRDLVESFAEAPTVEGGFGLFVLFRDYARSWDETLTPGTVRRSYAQLVEVLERWGG